MASSRAGADTERTSDYARLRQVVASRLRPMVSLVHLAEDATDEAVTRAWLRLGASSPWCRLVKWTVRTATRLLIDQHRRQVRKHIDRSVDVETLPANPPLDTGMLERLQQATAHFTPDQLTTLDLLVRGANTREIAAARQVGLRAAGKSVAALRRRLAAAGILAAPVPSARRPASLFSPS